MGRRTKSEATTSRKSFAQARGGGAQTARAEARGKTSEARRHKATGWATRKPLGLNL